MNRADAHRQLVEDLLAAPGSQDGWSLFLSRICDVLGGHSASFIAHDFSATDTQIAIAARTDPGAIAEYSEHWHRADPWAASPLTPRSHAGTVLHGEEMIAAADLRRTAFFNEFGRRYGIVGLIGFIEVSSRALSCLSIVAPAHEASFPTEDAVFLQALLPAVRRSLELHRRLSGAELASVRSAAILDHLTHGVLLLSALGKVVSANRAAEDILQANDALSMSRGELRATTPEATSQLRSAIGAAIARESSDSRVTRALMLPRASGRPLSVTIAPLPLQRRALVKDESVAVMFVNDPDRQLVDPDVVRSTWHLTPAEVRLACCLAAGMSLTEAAERLGLRLETARWRLKLIFQKTETTRQAELVRLLLTTTSVLFRG